MQILKLFTPSCILFVHASDLVCRFCSSSHLVAFTLMNIVVANSLFKINFIFHDTIVTPSNYTSGTLHSIFLFLVLSFSVLMLGFPPKE